MSKSNFVYDKVLPAVNKFSGNKAVSAMKDGILMIMPLSLIGSIFLLINFLPIPGWENFMASILGEAWREPFFQVAGATFDLMALVAVFTIPYNYAKREGIEGVTAGILGIVSFFILTPSNTVLQDGTVVGKVLAKNWSGGQGIVAAILIGLATGFIYTWFIKRDIRIKLPESVPSAVSNAFSALIPGFVIALASMIIYIIFNKLTGGTFIEWVYKILQIPLQGLTDSLGGAIVIALLISLLWWFGIHGIAVVMGVVEPLLIANAMANQAVVDAGQALTVSGGAHIVTKQFVDQFIILGGSGMTLGLVISMLLVAKSSSAKSLAKLSIGPAIFNINEPVIFGFPIALNPIMLIPFVAVPVCSAIITYTAVKVGFLAPFTAVTMPWTMPVVFSGFIVGGWQGAVLQILLVTMSIAVYMPFMKVQDSQNLKEENQNTKVSV